LPTTTILDRPLASERALDSEYARPLDTIKPKRILPHTSEPIQIDQGVTQGSLESLREVNEGISERALDSEHARPLDTIEPKRILPYTSEPVQIDQGVTQGSPESLREANKATTDTLAPPHDLQGTHEEPDDHEELPNQPLLGLRFFKKNGFLFYTD
ncbi:hypothetical protein EG327_002157, partial [Venturia inaequalis]